MRTIIGNERAWMALGSRGDWLKVESKGGDGVWRDWSSLFGVDYMIGGSFGEERDTPVMSASFVAMRKNGTNNSLAPNITSSSANTIAGPAYSPFLNIGREIRASVAVLRRGATPASADVALAGTVTVSGGAATFSQTQAGILSAGHSLVINGVAYEVLTFDGTTGATLLGNPTYAAGTPAGTLKADYREVFYGRIDSVNWEQDPLTVEASSLDGWLMDTQIEVDALQYGTTPVGTAMEAIIQQIVNAYHSGKLTTAQETLYTPVSPNFLVTDYKQGRVKVLEGLRTLAESIGYDVRFRYDSSHVLRLTFLDPQRNRATVDDTFGPGEYLDLKNVALNLANIRNVGKAVYRDANGVQSSVTASDSASITNYGRRYFELAASANIKTAAQATTLINAVVNDLSSPGMELSMQTSLFWPVQLYDRHTIQANGDHFDTDQTMAVVGYRHEFPPGQYAGTTTIQYAGKVIGAYADWLTIITPVLASDRIVPRLMPLPSENGAQGTLKLQLFDPQARMYTVEYATASANGTIPDPTLAIGGTGWTTAPAAVGGIYTLPSVQLLDKQPIRIAYRMFGDIGGGVQLLDNDVIRFALGAVPQPPDVSPVLYADGTLVVVSRGDSDTTAHRFAVKFSAPPTEAEIDAATLLDGRTATASFGPLTNGQRYFLGVKAYNTSYSTDPTIGGSAPIQKTDQWSGPSTTSAAVLVGSTSPNTNGITFNGITLGALTSDVIVSVREYTTDPGAVSSVARIGYRPSGSPIKRNGSLFIPVAKPGNWLVVTFSALDSLNREGSGSTQALNASSGEVTIKVQSLTVAAAQTDSPSITVAQNGANAVDVSMTMPAANLPASLRVFYDGVALSPDITRTAAAGAVQVFTHTNVPPNSTHTYQVYGVSATGVLSTVGSTPRTITLTSATIPAPTVTIGAYSTVDGGFPITVTPGTGSPSGVTWVVLHRPNTVQTATTAEQSTDVSFIHYHVQSSAGSTTDYLSVYGTKTDYPNSAASAEVAKTIPRYVGPA